MPGRPHLRALLAAVLLLGTAGCAVGVDAPDVSAKTRDACAEVVAALPDRVDDQERRDVDDDRQGAAWGDPAIVLRCGVGVPAGYTRMSSCQEVDGLGWFVPEEQMGTKARETTLTTLGRSPRIEVVVPADYWPPAAVMVDLGRSLLKATTKVGECA